MARAVLLLIGFVLLPLLLQPEATSTVNNTALPGCQATCGDVAIPYPFGVGEDCYAKELGEFDMTCDETTSPPTPYLGRYALKVLNISLAGQLRITGLIGYDCYNSSGRTRGQQYSMWIGETRPYTFSPTGNKFVVLGCDSYAFLNGSGSVNFTGGCISYCDRPESVRRMGGACSGVGCCETAIPGGLRRLSSNVNSYHNHANCLEFNPCGYAFLIDESVSISAISNFTHLNQNYKPPIVLDWSMEGTCDHDERSKTMPACRSSNSECFTSGDGNRYNCRCMEGYEGNPYLDDGCKDIDECKINSTICPSNGTCTNINGSYHCTCPPGTAADDPKKGPCNSTPTRETTLPLRLKLGLGVGLSLLFLMVIGSCLCWGFQRRKLVQQTRKITELKQRMFEQNGGLFLQELISTHHNNNRFRIFTDEELAAATNNFDDGQIIGRGGHGIVYKGRLEDNTDVAIKKSKMVHERQSKEFAREIGILSQINHINVVKLLGCCLEVEIPMLVYEFIQYGTLYDFIHHSKREGAPVYLDTRLRIGTEAAEALAYLHSYASPPILHGDVKTSNILLDEQYKAKVSDFGASTLAPVDETQLATVVQGTCGYLDPEYLQTYQLTVKSDVYSFGVVLAELLTGRKALELQGPEDERGLAVTFVSSLSENKLMQILDAHVANDGEVERLWEVAELTSRCLSLRGDDRPTMKEVVMALHILRSSRGHPWILCTPEEDESLLSGGEPSGYYYEHADAATGCNLSLENHVMLEIEAGR